MKINILTMFPMMFPGTLQYSLAGKALEKGIFKLNIVDIRDFADPNNYRVDDKPYGGNPGMIIKAEVISKALDFVLEENPDTKLIYMSPGGQKLNQDICRQTASNSNITILCGHFEGVDQRVIDHYNFYEISLGDYILSGGEIASMVLIDACVRLIPGVLGNEKSINEESFDFYGLLEYPQYTRPAVWREYVVPEVLRSGNHKKIEQWKLEQSMIITQKKRLDLIKKNNKEFKND